MNSVDTATVNNVENDSVNNNNDRVAKPVVCLPYNGVTYTESSKQLAEAYKREKQLSRKLFYRGGQVCMLCDDRVSGEISLENLTAATACTEFERVATLVKPAKQKEGNDGEKTVSYCPSVCTDAIANKILRSRDFINSLPPIRLITSAPVIVGSRDGSCKVINTYDATTGIYPKGSPVMDVSLTQAKELLLGIFDDYHFQSKSDKSRALAALITPALTFGGLINTRVPVMTVEADKSQAGKGFFNRLLCSIYGEKPIPVTQRGRGVGGTDEKFDAALCKGRPFISLDNFRGKIDSPQIESFLTEPTYQARVPHSGYVDIDPNRHIILATSNNIEMTRDMANRSNIIRIYKREDGYKYLEFTEGNMLDHVIANQSLYLGAGFAVVKEWVRQGKPIANDTRHDFRGWCRPLDWIVQNILDCAPLLDGHREAQVTTTITEFGWLKNVCSVVRDASELNTELTPYRIAELSEMGDVELSGSMGMSLEDLDEKGKGQVCSQIARKLAKIFKHFGSERELSVGEIKVIRQQRKVTYASGKSEVATVYAFDLASVA